MLNNTAIVSFVFRFINFFILIGLGTYIFKKYILVHVKHAIKESVARRAQLTNRQTQVQHALASVHHAMRNQHLENEYLLSRVLLWEQAMKKEREEKKQAWELQEKKLQEQALYKAQVLEKRRLYQEVMPMAYKKARHELEQYFMEESHQQSFVDAIIKTLEKSA